MSTDAEGRMDEESDGCRGRGGWGVAQLVIGVDGGEERGELGEEGFGGIDGVEGSSGGGNKVGEREAHHGRTGFGDDGMDGSFGFNEAIDPFLLRGIAEEDDAGAFGVGGADNHDGAFPFWGG